MLFLFRVRVLVADSMLSVELSQIAIVFKPPIKYVGD